LLVTMSSSLAVNRIRRELLELRNNNINDNPIEVYTNRDNLLSLRGLIYGPPDSPYAGAKFELEIIIPDNYPFMPPKNMASKHQHLSMSLRTMLLSIQALLDNPEPDDPQDAVVAKQYKLNRDIFNITAKHWASIYAHGPNRQPDCEAKVEKLVQMGFTDVILSPYFTYAAEYLIN
uniref:UBIQUITIN_CONJUGAT_2 domain-containing protein n=1 Tax=Hymenolepis diminuta TaxID=6216 RepID=A0A0R3SSE5_HYMDI